MAKKQHLSLDAIIGDDVMTPAEPVSGPSGAPVGQHLAESHMKAKDAIDQLTSQLKEERSQRADEVKMLQEEVERLRASGLDTGGAEVAVEGSELQAKEREGALLLQLSEAKAELQKLEEKLATFPDKGVFKIDPNRVRRSKFANRDELAFADPDFAGFQESIRANKGNDVPAKVRRVEGDPDHDYEVVYGHRRHQATKLTQTPFYATIHEVSDVELVRFMHMENQRVDLSVFEEGAQFSQWLDSGLYKSATALATDIGESKSFVSQRIAIQHLPEVVFKALKDPRQLKITAWRELCAAYRESSEKIVAVSTELAATVEDRAPAAEAEVRALFLKIIKSTKAEVQPKQIVSVSTPSGVPLFRTEKRGSGYLVRFDSAGVAEDIQEEALKKLETYLNEMLGGAKAR